MRQYGKTCAAALMLCAMGGNVWAATESAGCARPEDMTALKAAAIQQKLMVAALSCHAVELYNRFVVSYRKDLQASDQALQNFFRRMNGRTGTAAYHAYKTRLANASSMQSIGDMPGYCASAQAAFTSALDTTKVSLRDFVSRQDTTVDVAYRPCEVRTARPARPLPAQGAGLAAPN